MPPLDGRRLFTDNPEQLKFWDTGIDMKHIKDRAAELLLRTLSDKTRRAYAHDWIMFTRWCGEAGRTPLPASDDTVTMYAATACQKNRPSTVERRIAAIRARHRDYGVKVPDTTKALAVVSGARRSDPRPSAAKEALTVAHLRTISEALAAVATPKATLDRAIMVFGFASGMRRSEIAALQLSDVKLDNPKGVTVTIRRSKTDQDSVGRTLGIFRARNQEVCPVAALRHWIELRGRWEGPLFTRVTIRTGNVMRTPLSGQILGRKVKECVRLAGLDPELYAGHSLRAGMITAALETGAAESIVMRRTGHKSRMTLDRYVRPATVFSSDPLARAL